jgi:soluble lytic murein transglycosylase
MKQLTRLAAGLTVAVLSTAIVLPGKDEPVPVPARPLPSPPAAAGPAQQASGAPQPQTAVGPAPSNAGASAVQALSAVISPPDKDQPAEAKPLSPELAYADPGVAAVKAPSAETASLAPPDLAQPTRPDLARPDLATITAEAAAVKAALALYRKGDITEGDAAARAISSSAARTLLEWVAIRHNGAHIGFARLSAFLDQHRDWPQQDTIQQYAEEALWREKAAPETIARFFATRAPASADGKFALALVSRAEGKDKAAVALIREAWRRDPVDRDLERAIRDSFPDVLTDDDDRGRLERLAFKKDWTTAQRLASDIGSREERLLKARMALDRGVDPAKALTELSAADRSKPLIVFAEARELRRSGKKDEAAKVMAKAPTARDKVIEGDEWAQERRRLARGLLDAGSPREAYKVVSPEVAESETDNIESEVLAGWIALRFLKEPETAARHFALAEPHADLSTSVSRVAYWRGRAAEAAGKTALSKRFYEAAAQHVTTYYGQLSRARLGMTDLPVSEPLQGDMMVRAALEQRGIVQAIRLLYALDERDLATTILGEFAKRVEGADAMVALSHIATSLGDTRAELVVGKRALYRGFALEWAAFPTTGVPQFEAIGNSVERPMTYAIARQESAFEADAVSSAGARGLMQLMPATAKLTAQRAGLPYDLDRLTSDPAYNATLGTAHLGDLVAYWRGSYLLTFAAYNAGPGNVRKWIAAYGDPRSEGVDTVDWVERIPFEETRNYVQRIMENLQVYRHILGDRTALLIEQDLHRGSFQ